ncbi:MAG: TolC family protein [Planctomycetes bacterium]|nr:TolC family protein [Planctomycetota bacterium]
MAIACALPCGCSFSTDKKLHYIGKPEPEEVVTSKFSIGDVPPSDYVSDALPVTVKPRTIGERNRDKIWDMSLAEAIHLSLINNKLVNKTQGDFLSPGNQLWTNPDGVISIYDAAIRDSGYLFGNRGVESALSVFDPVFAQTLSFGNQATVTNNFTQSGGITPGGILNQDTAQSQTSLTKSMGYGAQLGVSQTINYSNNNINQPLQLFNSVFTGNLQLQYTQPLLAGAGTEFARISGPTSSSIQGVSGLNQGVVIARINTDITLLDFETNVRNMVKDVEDAYWNLYLAYQNYHSQVESRNASYQLWQTVKTKFDIGLEKGGGAEEAQAREAYFEARARAEAALGAPSGSGRGSGGIYGAELALRRLCGLPANDGQIIRPSDEPSMAPLATNWDVALATACTRREELRKQKWNIKSIELQLRAAKNLARPTLNFQSSYQLNGFGENLFGDNTIPAGQPGFGLQNYYNNIFGANNTGWQVGLQFQVPLGLRNAHAQVRNTELRLQKAQTVLEAQESEISHELAATFQAIDYHFQSMQTSYNRRQAAADNLEAIQTDFEIQRKPLDLVLQAQAKLMIADITFYNSVVEYNKALTELQYRQGTLLEYNHIHLAERDWGPDALAGARRLARARSYGYEPLPFDPIRHEPEAMAPRHFSSPELPDSMDAGSLLDLQNSPPASANPQEPALLPEPEPEKGRLE